MNKVAVICMSIGDNRKFADINRETFKSYADKIKADFIIYGDPEVPYEIKNIKYNNKDTHNIPYVYLKKLLIINDALSKYDRVIYLDDSCYICKDCPNLFNIVPDNFIGAHNEGMTEFSRGTALISNKSLLSYGLGSIPIINYFNAGILVISECHRYLFSNEYIIKYGLKGVFSCQFSDQTYLNAVTEYEHLPVFTLGTLFSKMCVSMHTNDYADWSWEQYINTVRNTHDFSFLTRENLSPGNINHAFIYHFTSVWNNQQRLKLSEKLKELCI